MITFKKIDFFTASKEDWIPVHTFRRQFKKEEFPEDPITEDHSWEISEIGYLKNYQMNHAYYIICSDNKPIGIITYQYFDKESASYKGNEKILFFEIQILKAFRNKGIGSKALKILLDPIRKANKSILITETDVISSKGFVEKTGGKITQIFANSKLVMNDLNKNLLQRWVTEASKNNPETDIYFLDNGIPEKFIEAFAIAFTDTGNDQPKDSDELGQETVTAEMIRNEIANNQAAGIKVLSCITVEKTGEVSALSQIKMFPGREEHLAQNLTGVPEMFKGRKLGKWVKSYMLLNILEKYPNTKAIITGNSDSNGPMLHINNSLGFKKYKEAFVAQITSEQLELFLKSSHYDLSYTFI